MKECAAADASVALDLLAAIVPHLDGYGITTQVNEQTLSREQVMC